MGRKKFDCIVIGGGPGGLVAAIYLKRFRRSVCLVDGGHSRASKIPRIRNLIGYVDGISGSRLLENLRAQANELKINIYKGEVTIKKLKTGFSVLSPNRKMFAKKIILATGMIDVKPEFENLELLEKSGLLAYCPICDAYDHRSKSIGIFVSSPAGLKKIKFISRFSNDVHVFVTKKVRLAPAQAALIKKCGAKFHSSPVIAVEISPNRKELLIFTKEKKHKVAFSYVSMGTIVPSRAFEDLRGLRLTREGFLQTNRHQETSIQGLYAAGDCVNGLSQISVAIGQSAIAATSVHNSF
jgi:thioredoxin reductase (NADPH)